ncbi:ATP phosphoribosyltransferase regulatory subunit [Gottfriedia solisilvae]|uniref:ATP phosphoribosyltransferase regulatory subunit n=1 Tax=Gottfriedia solisilvae TaxID=1516104 RepID=A0A8J3ANR7_9BACI|nr:ATP phosphoribosyltransferase regulatory subunit [Gottfriedia solisilvae]
MPEGHAGINLYGLFIFPERGSEKVNGKLLQALKSYEYKRKMEDYVIDRGYIPFEPQVFEEFEHFAIQNPRLPREELVVLLSGKQQILLLRPDITSALMKEIYPIALKEEKCKIFYQSIVYRNNEEGIKEINQFGIENFGEINESTEIEIIVMAIDLLSKQPFILEIGHTGFLEGLFNECDLSKEQKNLVKRLIYLKNSDELKIWSEKTILPKEVKRVLNELFNLQGKGKEISSLLTSCILNKQMDDAVHKILRLQEISPNIHVDFSIINELDYYDGIVFKGYYDRLNKEVLRGGRYKVLSEDSEKMMDAIGFSIDTNAWIECQEVAYK